MNQLLKKTFQRENLFKNTFLACTAGVSLMYLYFWRETSHVKVDTVAKVDTEEENAERPFISIVVPARNEERQITRCLASLLRQKYPHFEVILVDDQSDDNTLKAASELSMRHPYGKKLKTIHINDLPESWAGKPHALHVGAESAEGEWLLFTDADTWHHPATLISTIAYAQKNNLDMLTMETYQELGSFWERVLMPVAFMGIAAQYPVRKVNEPGSKLAIANGQFILIRQSVYKAIGGYANKDLRQSIVDDRDLARVMKENGYRIYFGDGRHLVRVRMYQSLGEVFNGFTKNAFIGSRGGVPLYILGILGLPIITIQPYLSTLAGISALRSRKPSRRKLGSLFLIGGLIQSIPMFLFRRSVNKRLSLPPWQIISHGLGGLVFEGILLRSMWRVISRKGVTWRGRSYVR